LTPMRLLHALTHHRRNNSVHVPKINPRREVPCYPSNLQLDRVNECNGDVTPTRLTESVVLEFDPHMQRHCNRYAQ
jgi:hypothetical protein